MIMKFWTHSTGRKCSLLLSLHSWKKYLEGVNRGAHFNSLNMCGQPGNSPEQHKWWDQLDLGKKISCGLRLWHHRVLHHSGMAPATSPFIIPSLFRPPSNGHQFVNTVILAQIVSHTPSALQSHCQQNQNQTSRAQKNSLIQASLETEGFSGTWALLKCLFLYLFGLFNK